MCAGYKVNLGSVGFTILRMFCVDLYENRIDFENELSDQSVPVVVLVLVHRIPKIEIY